MRRLTLISLVLLAAVLLSACATGANSASWPGLAADNSNAYLASGGFVYAIRLSDGSKAWQYPDKSGSSQFYSNPVITSDGQVIVGSSGQDKGLYCLDPATGQQKWTAPFVASDHWVAPPLVVDQTIYAANNNGTLYAINLATGQKFWELSVSHSFWGAPVTNGKLIFVTSLDHFLYAVDPETHKIAWKTDLGGSSPGSPSISEDGSSLYIGSFAKKVFAVDAASGSIRWTATVKDWVWSAPTLDGDSLYAADISGNIYSFGAPNGKNAWPTTQPDGAITGGMVALSNEVLVATETGSLLAFDHTGARSWDAAVGGKIYTTPVASGDRIVVAPMNADFLLAAVSQDGKLLWKFTGK